MSEANTDIISLTADIVSSMVSNNKVAIGDVAGLIASTYEALIKAGEPAPEPDAAPTPAVSVKQSVKHDYLVCLEDGKKLKMLKRYLRTNYNMTPEQYRAKWGLPITYPMVAPAYADQRRELAKEIGLGKGNTRKPAPKAPAKKSPVKSSVKGLEAARAHLAGDAKPAAKRGRPAKAKAKPVEAAAEAAGGNELGNG